jgi:hypothetical protein
MVQATTTTTTIKRAEEKLTGFCIHRAVMS